MQAFLIIPFLAAILGVYTQTDYCLECICGMESGNATFPGCGIIDDTCGLIPGCRVDSWDGTCICGPYDIKYNYYIDCAQELGWDTDEAAYFVCATEEECSRECIRGYMQRYGTLCTGKIYQRINCTEFAGIHHGGLQGCNAGSTRDYRIQVGICCQRSGNQCDNQA